MPLTEPGIQRIVLWQRPSEQILGTTSFSGWLLCLSGSWLWAEANLVQQLEREKPEPPQGVQGKTGHKSWPHFHLEFLLSDPPEAALGSCDLSAPG